MEIKREEAAQHFKLMQNSKHGREFTEWLFSELGYGRPLANSDARKQERNVALHDFAAELEQMLK